MKRKTVSEVCSAMYTAKEIREVSNRLLLEEGQTMLITDAADILSRVADALEIEEERSKTYEYSISNLCGAVFGSLTAARLKMAMVEFEGRDCRILRREVGEWEEVRDDS